MKLLLIEEMVIKNGDVCVLTHFENFNNIYVSKAHELVCSQVLKETIESKRKCCNLNICI